MKIISLFTFSISSSCDSFIIGLNYGFKKIKINFFLNTYVALISAIGTFLSMSFGNFISRFLSKTYSSYLGASSLVLFGVYMLGSSLKGKRKKASSYSHLLNNPELLDINKSNTIELKEATYLGLFLSLNNLGIGAFASISGINILFASLLSFIFSLVFFKAGLLIGQFLYRDKFSNMIEIASAIAIIVLGILFL